MNQLRLMFSGVSAMEKFRQMCHQAKWVGAGTFGIGLETFWGNLLPADSQIIVGVPREEVSRGNCIRMLGALKARHPKLVFAYREDFHAKYSLFRMARSKWVMLGSANLTMSPALETVACFQDEQLFDSLVKRHEKWLAGAHAVQPYNSVKLEKSVLAGLSSQVVEG